MPPRSRRLSGRVAIIVLALVATTGCPSGKPRTPASERPELPALEWTVQLEGNPWPQGIVADTLLVWSFRKAMDGFLFPIQLSAHAPTDGANIWTTPIRPWLMDRDVPWSFDLAQAGPVVGAWVKGDVVRLLNRSDGGDAWSLPRCRGILAVGDKLWALSGRELIVLEATRGREERRIALPGEVAAPPVLAGGRVLVLLQSQELVALDPGSGKELWRLKLTNRADRVAGPPQGLGEHVLIPQLLPAGGDYGVALVLRRARDGAALWQALIPAKERPKRASDLRRVTLAGDLVLWPDRALRCFRAFDLTTGRRRFEVCNVNPDIPPVRWGNTLYLLGDDAKSRDALSKGAPWYTVDFPLLAVNARTGATSRVTVLRHRHRRRGALSLHRARARRRPIRAIRLSLSPPTNGMLYLVQRNKFLTALRVAWPAGSTPVNGK